jgi:hypothetical protein
MVRVGRGSSFQIVHDHGIDDAFLGKASVTWYFYQGKRLRLQGAD